VFYSRLLLLAAVFLGLSGCGGRTARPDVIRLVIVNPQDTSGAATDAGRALRLALLVPFSGLSDAMVLVQPSRRQAADLAPHFLVEPQIEGQRIVLVVFDALANRHLRDVECQLTACAAALGAAIGVTPRAVPALTVSIPPQAGEEQLAALVRQFPDSAVVREEWMNLLIARGQRDAAGRIAAEALRRPWPPLEKAQFELAAASLRGDAAGSLTAIAATARAWPANAALQLQAAEGLNQARRFREAIPFFRAALRAEPASFPVYATLSFTQALAGEKPELRPATTAADHDLMGDLAFLGGDCPAAEAAYRAAAGLDTSSPPGKLYAKAAEAALLQNELARADGHMQRFLAGYQTAVPGMAGLVQGLWLWRTGRRAEALRQTVNLPAAKPLFAFLDNPGAGGPTPVAPALQALAQGRAAEAAEALAAFIAQQPLVAGLRWEPLLALALAEAGKPGEACALLSHWGTPPPPDDWSGALFWPRPLLVRAACLEKTDAARAQQLRGLVGALQPR
jgi:tetratricopeptide (TPR) repeat protein